MGKLKLGQRLKQLAGNLAPMVGTAIGGPFGGIATKMVQQALGVDSEDAALQALESDPEAVLKLKTAELNFKQFMREADIKEEELAVRDRASARELAAKTTLLPQMVLGGLYTVAYIGTLLLFITGNVSVDLEYKEMVIGLLGTLGAVQVQILNFFFGSSSGSKEKTFALARNGS